MTRIAGNVCHQLKVLKTSFFSGSSRLVGKHGKCSIIQMYSVTGTVDIWWPRMSFPPSILGLFLGSSGSLFSCFALGPLNLGPLFFFRNPVSLITRSVVFWSLFLVSPFFRIRSHQIEVRGTFGPFSFFRSSLFIRLGPSIPRSAVIFGAHTSDVGAFGHSMTSGRARLSHFLMSSSVFFLFSLLPQTRSLYTEVRSPFRSSLVRANHCI